jgi:PAS domain S-box-containing protein
LHPSLPGNLQRRTLAVVPAILVLLVGALAYQRARSVIADVGAVERSHGIIEASDVLLTRAVDAETGQRAFLLTGNERFLEPFSGARADVQRSLDSLSALIKGDSSETAALTAIAAIIPERFALLDTGIAMRRRNDPATYQAARLMVGKQAMDRLRQAIGRLQARELTFLENRHAAERRSLRNAAVVVGLAAIAALIISAMVSFAFSRALKDRESSNTQLRLANEDLEQQASQLELQAAEMESQAAELEATAEDLRSTNDELNRTTRRAEDARNAAEASRLELEQVLDSLPEAATVFDREWRWLYVNPAAAAMLTSLGLDAAKVNGKLVWEELPRFKGTRFETEARRATDENRVVEFEEYIPDLDVWVENTIVPSSRSVIAFTRDITRLKREQSGARLLSEASRALASTLDYETTLNAVASLAVGELADWCGVDLVQPDGEVRQVVVAHKDPEKVKWAKELGRKYPPDYSAPNGVGNVIRTGKPEVYRDITDEMLVAGARDDEHLAITRELQIKSAVIAPMIARGKTLGAITLIGSDSGRRYRDEDVALVMELATRSAIAIDNAQLYREALAASQSKSVFLATMSHELRTPLNAIIGYQALLHDGITGELNDLQRNQLTRIRASADHLLQLIDEILTFSRLEAGKEVVKREDVELRPMVSEALAMVAPQAQAKGLKLVERVDDVRLVTDRGKMRQVLLNLLSNAIKFSDDGDVIVTSEARGRTIAVSVIDPGIGITPDNLEKIFDPFWQVEQQSTRRAGGTGLGLSVSRSLARLLGGDVIVTSTPQQGSTFTLLLPGNDGANS